MNLPTRCPHCGATNIIAFSTLGKAVACENCHRIFVSSPLAEGERDEVAEAAAKRLPFAAGAASYSLPDLELEMVRVPAGGFTMGNALGTANERPERKVSISQPLYIAIQPVTQSQYREIMEDSPSYFEGPENPVECVSWYQAMEFCRRLSERERVAGKLPREAFFRLPSEAEWEYACRRGEDDDREAAGSNETVLVGEPDTLAYLSAGAWFSDNSQGSSHPVGGKRPNALGLFDMQGNVAEWCLDWYGVYPEDQETDPTGPANGRRKVRRGGGWASVASRCRSTDRAGILPNCRCALIGFRVVLTRTGICPYDRDYLIV